MTKTERIEVLKKAKQRIEKGDVYMCIAIKNACIETEICPCWLSTDLLFEIFPELLKFKPKHQSLNEGWFPRTPQGQQIRHEILDKIIAEIESE